MHHEKRKKERKSDCRIDDPGSQSPITSLTDPTQYQVILLFCLYIFYTATLSRQWMEEKKKSVEQTQFLFS